MNHLPVQVAAPSIIGWQQGSNGTPYVHERLGSLPGPDVLVTALVHGNEYSGAIVIDELLASGWQPIRGRVTFAFCNVAAFERFDSSAPDASRLIDEDFNRVWSTARLDSTHVSTELARARQLLPLVQRATHLLDLHSMHELSAPLLVTGTLPRNIDFAQALQTPSQVIIDRGHADGVRMRDYGAFADPHSNRIALLLEAGQHWQTSSVAVSKNTVARFLVHAGSMKAADAPPDWLLPNITPPAPLQVTDSIVAQSMDFTFTQAFTGGEVIANAGSVIAVDAGKSITTPYDNCVLVMPSVRQLKPGVTTVRLGKMALVH
jgi:predicted deacylase